MAVLDSVFVRLALNHEDYWTPSDESLAQGWWGPVTWNCPCSRQARFARPELVLGRMLRSRARLASRARIPTRVLPAWPLS